MGLEESNLVQEESSLVQEVSSLVLGQEESNLEQEENSLVLVESSFVQELVQVQNSSDLQLVSHTQMQHLKRK